MNVTRLMHSIPCWIVDPCQFDRKFELRIRKPINQTQRAKKRETTTKVLLLRFCGRSADQHVRTPATLFNAEHHQANDTINSNSWWSISSSSSSECACMHCSLCSTPHHYLLHDRSNTYTCSLLSKWHTFTTEQHVKVTVLHQLKA